MSQNVNFGKLGSKEVDERLALEKMVIAYGNFRLLKKQGLKVKRPCTKKSMLRLQTSMNKKRSTLGLRKLNVLATLDEILKENEA